MHLITRRTALALAGLAPFVPLSAQAGRYPDRPIRVISPYAAGGVGQTIIDLFSVSVEPKLGQKLVLESKPGAAGNIGIEEVARAAPSPRICMPITSVTSRKCGSVAGPAGG